MGYRVGLRVAGGVCRGTEIPTKHLVRERTGNVRRGICYFSAPDVVFLHTCDSHSVFYRHVCRGTHC